MSSISTTQPAADGVIPMASSLLRSGTEPTLVWGLAKMRRDGFVSHDAGEGEGTLTTRNVQFSSNPGHFFVNADVAPGGSVKVEVLNSSGEPITGFTKSQSSAATRTGAGSTKQSITWSGGSIGSPANTSVKFKFYLTNAKIYSFWVSDNADGRSNGYIAQGGPGLLSNKDNGRSADRNR